MISSSQRQWLLSLLLLCQTALVHAGGSFFPTTVAARGNQRPVSYIETGKNIALLEKGHLTRRERQQHHTSGTYHTFPMPRGGADVIEVEMDNDKKITVTPGEENNTKNQNSLSAKQLPIFSTWSPYLSQPLTSLHFEFPPLPTTANDVFPAPFSRYLLAHCKKKGSSAGGTTSPSTKTAGEKTTDHDHTDDGTAKARLTYQQTLDWRNKEGVNDILARPHETFDVCVRAFPVRLPGRDAAGNVIVIQRPGGVDLPLLEEHNLSLHDWLHHHYLYVVEYCWNLLDAPPEKQEEASSDKTAPAVVTGRMTTILDCQGLSFTKCWRSAPHRQFFQDFVKVLSDNYPSRSAKTILVNAPTWIQMAYQLVQPLLRESTKAKVVILGVAGAKNKKKQAKQEALLRDVLGADQYPIVKDILDSKPAIGKEGELVWSPIETDLRQLVTCILESHGQTLKVP